MKHHPESVGNEVFIGNSFGPLPAPLVGIKGLRLGAQAFDCDGRPLDADYRPILADPRGAAEYDRVREARLSALIRGEV